MTKEQILKQDLKLAFEAARKGNKVTAYSLLTNCADLAAELGADLSIIKNAAAFIESM